VASQGRVVFFVAGGAALQISYLLDGFRRYNGKYGDSRTWSPKVLYHLQKSELNLSGLSILRVVRKAIPKLSWQKGFWTVEFKVWGLRFIIIERFDIIVIIVIPSISCFVL
jgi:hypothetical protein